MKTFIEIRERIKIVKIYKFYGQISIGFYPDYPDGALITVLEHENNHKETRILLEAGQNPIIRNWGNDK